MKQFLPGPAFISLSVSGKENGVGVLSRRTGLGGGHPDDLWLAEKGLA